MKDVKKRCIKCKQLVSKVIDKDYPLLTYYFCNNAKCPRCGLLTVIFEE